MQRECVAIGTYETLERAKAREVRLAKLFGGGLSHLSLSFDALPGSPDSPVGPFATLFMWFDLHEMCLGDDQLIQSARAEAKRVLQDLMIEELCR